MVDTTTLKYKFFSTILKGYKHFAWFGIRAIWADLPTEAELVALLGINVNGFHLVHKQITGDTIPSKGLYEDKDTSVLKWKDAGGSVHTLDVGYTLPAATTTTKGGVSVPVLGGLDVDANGILGMNIDGDKGLALDGTTGALGVKIGTDAGLQFSQTGVLQIKLGTGLQFNESTGAIELSGA